MQTLLDYLLGTLGYFKFWHVMYEYEEGIVMRLGKYNHHMKPGVNYIIPFNVDEPSADSVLVDTEEYEVQSIDTGDGESVAFVLVITWSVNDIKLFNLATEDSTGVMRNMVCAKVAGWVAYTNYAEVFSEDFWKERTKEARRLCKPYGIYIKEVGYTTLCRTKNVRIIGDSSNYYNEDEDE